MKKLLLFAIFFAISCTSPKQGVEGALQSVPDNQRSGMQFLIDYMPQGDRDTLSKEFLLTEVDWAYKARETFPWCAELPQEVFFNDVLPYASMNEERELWREKMWNMFYPLVKDAKDIRTALDTVTRSMAEVTGVEYNTKRNRPHQAPSESMEIGMASCSGLSILLVDALRTVGIPARIAGTPLWVSKEGNHNWVEVFVDGKWYFTEFYPAENLNEGWFLERAGKADKSDPIYWIYATSWKPVVDSLHFPMVWDEDDKSVPGVDVTDFYIDLYNAAQSKMPDGVATSIRMYKSEGGEHSSADRVSCDLVVKDSQGVNVASGTTRGETADMNDYLVVYLRGNRDYVVEYSGKSEEFRVGSEAYELNLYAE
ncbi:MAG: transglutaminase-like domain-containing protein [Rikenellaceae bacterium]